MALHNPSRFSLVGAIRAGSNTTVTQNALGYSIAGGSTVTVANEATDTTCFPVFVTAATGDLGPKTNAGLTYNSNTNAFGVGAITATSITCTSTTLKNVFAHTASVAGLGTIEPIVQIHGLNTTNSSQFLYNWANNNTNSNALFGHKSRGTTVGSHAVVSSGDVLFQAGGSGSDGTVFRIAGYISFEADAGWSSGDSPGRIVFLTTPDTTSTSVEALRIDNAQRSILGGVASVTVGNAGKLQVVGTSAATSQIQSSHHSADAVGPNIALAKSRHATAGSNTIVQDGDDLGSITAYGADGTNYDTAAQILFEVDGTPGAGTDMPGRILFLTSTNGTATLTEALRIDNAQVCTFAANPAGRIIGSTYSPTSSAASNLDANPTMTQAQYMRVGATVTVSGTFSADATAGGAASFEISLPVASDVGAVEDVAGVAFSAAISEGAAITGSVANNTAVVSWVAVDTASQSWSYTLTYQVI